MRSWGPHLTPDSRVGPRPTPVPHPKYRHEPGSPPSGGGCVPRGSLTVPERDGSQRMSFLSPGVSKAWLCRTPSLPPHLLFPMMPTGDHKDLDGPVCHLESHLQCPTPGMAGGGLRPHAQDEGALVLCGSSWIPVTP